MSKTRVLKSWSKRNLPEELWPEILSRLPVKSLLRFRCVSRAWKVMIDDPHFTRLHLNRFNNFHEPHLFFVLGSSYECVVKNSKTLRTNFSLGFLQSDLESAHILRTTPARTGACKRWYIVSSIDGLFILKSGGGSDLMLWNPSIRKTLTLPPSYGIPPFGQNVDFGLGFDQLIKDYKFVRFVILPTGGVQFVAIYTLGTNSWKAIDFQGEDRQDIRFCHGRRSIPFNGVLYALAKDQISSPMKLVSFDLRCEVFASIEVPEVYGPEYIGTYQQALTMVDDGCSLAVVNLSKPKGSIWALEMVGDDIKSWSWVQLYTFATVIPEYTLYTWKLKFLCLKKNGEMLLKWDNMVICYNLETQQEKIMLEKNKKKLHEGYTLPYIESLILHSIEKGGTLIQVMLLWK